MNGDKLAVIPSTCGDDDDDDDKLTLIPSTCGGDDDDNGDTTTTSFTIDDALEIIGFGRYQWYLLVMCGVGYAAGTMELVLITFLLPELKKEWGSAVSDYGASALAVSVFSGSLLGSVFWGWLSDKIGRKLAFVATVLISTVFGIASAFSPSLIWIIVFRFGVGFAIGGNMSIDFVLFLENIAVFKRGTYLSLITLFGVGGVLLTVGIAWATIPSSTYGWRWFLIFTTLPSASLLGFRLLASHESPRYLIASGNIHQAHEVLKAIAYTNNVHLPLEWHTLVYTEHSSSDDDHDDDDHDDDELRNFKLLLSPSLRRMSMLLWIFWFLLTFAYYGVTIWLPKYLSRKHLDSSDDLYFTFLLMGLSELPGLLLATILVDRIGRKYCLCGFMCGCAIFTLLFAVAESRLAVRMFTCLIYFHVVGAWSVIYIYTPEVYPTFLRTTASGAKSVFATFGGIISPLVGALLFNTLGHAWVVLFVYASAFLLGAIISIMFTVETRNMPLSDRIIHFSTSDTK